MARVLQSDGYPGLESVEHDPTKQVLRYLFDKLKVVKDNADGPIVGTLLPDTKPRLTPLDIGRLFHSTDFDRTFRWTGSAWTDAPSQPARAGIAFFDPTINPGLGWTRCNGSQVTISTSEGRTLAFVTPVVADISGQRAWIRL